MAFKIRTTEHIEAKAYIKWCFLHPLLKDIVLHIPNEGKRSPMMGFNLKLMGLRPGVSDFFIPLPTPIHHGLWIELKAKGGKVTISQKDWLQRMKFLAYDAHVAYGWEQAKEITEAYLSNVQPLGVLPSSK